MTSFEHIFDPHLVHTFFSLTNFQLSSILLHFHDVAIRSELTIA